MVVISREGSNPREFIAQNDVLKTHEENIHIVTEWITNDGKFSYQPMSLLGNLVQLKTPQPHPLSLNPESKTF